MTTKEEINEARAKVDAELFQVNKEIKTRIEQRRRLEEERLRLMGLLNKALAAELDALKREQG